MQEALPSLTDIALLQLYHQGDQRAFEQLVERYHPHLFCYLMRVLRDSDMVGDVMQHVWIQCAFAPSPYRAGDSASLKGWLFHVARNRAIDLLRRRTREKLRTISLVALASDGDDDVPGSIGLRDPRPGPEALVEQREMFIELLQAIATLPPAYQQIVYLRLWQERTYEEIVQRLAMPKATAKTYFHRSRLRLVNILANWGDTGGTPQRREEDDRTTGVLRKTGSGEDHGPSSYR